MEFKTNYKGWAEWQCKPAILMLEADIWGQPENQCVPENKEVLLIQIGSTRLMSYKDTEYWSKLDVCVSSGVNVWEVVLGFYQR